MNAVDAQPTTTADVRRRAGRSAVWLFGLQGFLLVAGFAQKIVLARLLTPNEFGLIGICLLVIALLDVFTETGLISALIHERTVRRPELDTLWTVSVLRGVVLGTLVVLLAAPVAGFFSAPGSEAPLRALAVVFVLSGLTNPAMLLFRRELTYGRIVAQRIAGTLIELAVGITLAIVLQNVWALVGATIANYTTSLALSYLLHPYRPSFRLHVAVLRRLSRFSRWVTANAILVWLLNQGDDFVVGRLLGAGSLGLYQMAFQLSNLPATQVTHVIGDVAFPAYARLRDGDAIRRAYLGVLKTVAFVSVPMAGGIMILSPMLVKVAFGPNWEPMIGAAQVLALWGLIRSIGANSGPLFNALGRPEIQTQQAALRLAVMAALIVPMTRWWGITGAAIAVLVAAMLVAPLTYVRSVRLSGCGTRPFLTAVFVPLANAAVMVGVLFASERLFAVEPSLWWLVVQVVLGIAVYGGLSLGWRVWTGYDGFLPIWRAVAGAWSRVQHKAVRVHAA